MKKATEFKVDSGYLLPGLDLKGLMPSFAIRQIAISSGSDGGDGSLEFDPNTCALDEFGVTGACTKIATQSIPAEVKLLKESADGRKLYSVEPKGYTGPGLRVVLRADDAGDEEFVAQLLVLDDTGSIQQIVSLKGSTQKSTQS